MKNPLTIACCIALLIISRPSWAASPPTQNTGLELDKVGFLALGATELYFLSQRPVYLGGAYILAALMGVSGRDQEEINRGYTCLALGTVYNFTRGQSAPQSEVILANIAIWSWSFLYSPPSNSQVASSNGVAIRVLPDSISLVSSWEF
jgi:hypothetical protein